jgi:hypothetical protein
MENNQATIDKLAETHPGALEFDASVDAIKWLQQSPGLPSPTIHIAVYGDRLGITLQWMDEKKTMWVRASFAGDGEFDWMVCFPYTIGVNNERDFGRIPVSRGVPSEMMRYVNAMMRDAA